MAQVFDQMKDGLLTVLKNPSSLKEEAQRFADVCIPENVEFVATWTGVAVDETGQAPVRALFYHLCDDVFSSDGKDADIALQRYVDIFYGCSPNQRMVNDLIGMAKEEEPMVRMFEKVFCPTGTGGGVDPTCSPGKAAGYSAPQKNSDGYVPGTVGGFAGVSTAGWNATNAAAQKIMKKIAILEQAAAEGKWGLFHANMSNASMEASSSKLLKTLLVAQNNLLAAKHKAVMSIPDGAEPAKPASAPTPPPSEPADPFTAADVMPPLVADGSAWKKVGGQLGTEKAGIYEMGGKKYYVKQPDNVDRAKNEVLTNKLYQLAGADTAQAHLIDIDGKMSVASEWVDGAAKINFNDKANQIKAQSDFAAHVWLNNRDAIGAGSENPEANIVADKNGNFKIVDTGGGLDYGGMGGGGKKDFDNQAKEWTSMVDPKVNPTMAKVFGGMTDQQKIDSISKLDHIQMDDVKKLFADVGHENPKLAATLMGRLNNLRSIRDDLKNKLAAQAPPAPILQAEVTGYEKYQLQSHEIPLKPHFLSKDAKAVAENQAAVDKIHEAAKTGDLTQIEAIGFSSKSPKVSSYATAVLSTMKDKANGPKPVNASASKTEGSISSKGSSPDAQTGLDKIGYYSVVGKIEPFVPSQHTISSKKSAGQWTAGKSYHFKQDPETKAALKHYTGSGYHHMNEGLRKGKPPKDALLVANALMKAPFLKEGAVLNRKHDLPSGDKEKLLQALPGTIIQEKGILSTSTKPGTWSGSVDLKITIGKGVRGIPAKGFSLHPNENEVMLPPNTRFLITEVQQTSSYKTTVHVIALPTEDNQCCPP